MGRNAYKKNTLISYWKSQTHQNVQKERKKERVKKHKAAIWLVK